MFNLLTDRVVASMFDWVKRPVSVSSRRVCEMET